ncbi:MAG: dipeptide/oligopeptide/nickel ABC transporter ATP-binding protein [Terriglobales bacterium]
METDASGVKPAVQPVLRVSGLSKSYRRKGVGWQRSDVVVAASKVECEIFAGQTLALVGSSGSGKSTVARCVTRLEKPDAGQIWLEGTDIAQLDSRELRSLRPKVQMVFQDAATSMNPRFTAADVIEEPLRIQRQDDKSARRTRAKELLQEVGLSPQWANRSALDFSGGQRQRLAIARALALKPQLLVLDEALSGLDLSIEAQIVNLLLDLQAAHALAYLLISHDLALVARLADMIAVMANGRIVEQGPALQVMVNASHAETRALVASTRAAQANLAALGIAL